MEAGDRLLMGKEGALTGGQEVTRVRVCTCPAVCGGVTSPLLSVHPQQPSVLPLQLASYRMHFIIGDYFKSRQYRKLLLTGDYHRLSPVFIQVHSKRVL